MPLVGLFPWECLLSSDKREKRGPKLSEEWVGRDFAANRVGGYIIELWPIYNTERFFKYVCQLELTPAIYRTVTFLLLTQSVADKEENSPLSL